jgi:ADP-ribose pyrophosphatase
MKSRRPKRIIQPWRLLGVNLELAAPPWVTVYREHVELPSGRVLDDFYKVVLTDFAAVVALTAKKELVMTRAYKHGLGQVTLGVPAGYIEPGESPLRTARRELLEETGYEAQKWRALGSYVVDGNHYCSTMHLFLAGPVKAVKPPQRDETEEIQVELMTIPSLVAAIRKSDVHHLVTASAIAIALLFELE